MHVSSIVHHRSLPCVIGSGQDTTNSTGSEEQFWDSGAPVLKVYSTKDGEHKFIAYLVKWGNIEAIVSDPLAWSDFKVGDTIKSMAQKVHL